MDQYKLVKKVMDRLGRKLTTSEVEIVRVTSEIVQEGLDVPEGWWKPIMSEPAKLTAAQLKAMAPPKSGLPKTKKKVKQEALKELLKVVEKNAALIHEEEQAAKLGEAKKKYPHIFGNLTAGDTVTLTTTYEVED